MVPRSYLERVAAADREVRWRNRLIDATRQIALAEVSDQLIGVLSWCVQVDELPPLEIASLYVGSAHRSSGVGSQMLNEAIGQRPAYLWVFTANRRAWDFYLRHGFVADGGRQIDPDTELMMSRLVR